MTFTPSDISILNEMFDKKLKPIQNELNQVKEDLKKEIKSSLTPLKRDIRSIKKDLNWVMGKYDTRLNHLEKHFDHPPGRIDN